MESSLIINSTDTTGKKLQKSITNLNPNISNATAKEFAQKLNALTTNEYQGATRINKIDVEEEDVGGGRNTFYRRQTHSDTNFTG